MENDANYSHILIDTSPMISPMMGEEVFLKTKPSLNILVHGAINLLYYEH